MVFAFQVCYESEGFHRVVAHERCWHAELLIRSGPIVILRRYRSMPLTPKACAPCTPVHTGKTKSNKIKQDGDGGCATKRRACKDCSCGRAEMEMSESAPLPLTAVSVGNVDDIVTSACGNCSKVRRSVVKSKSKTDSCRQPTTFLW